MSLLSGDEDWEEEETVWRRLIQAKYEVENGGWDLGSR